MSINNEELIQFIKGNIEDHDKNESIDKNGFVSINQVGMDIFKDSTNTQEIVLGGIKMMMEYQRLLNLRINATSHFLDMVESQKTYLHLPYNILNDDYYIEISENSIKKENFSK